MDSLPPPAKDAPLFIPLPPSERKNGTPILKWILSRPNTHLLPLHLLTTCRSLGRAEKDTSPDDVTVGFAADSVGEGRRASVDVGGLNACLYGNADGVSGEGRASVDVVGLNADGVSDDGGEQKHERSLPLPLFTPPLAFLHGQTTSSSFLQNPLPMTSSMKVMDGSEEAKAPLFPSVPFSSLPPLPPMSSFPPSLFGLPETQHLLQPLQHPPSLQPLPNLQQLQPADSVLLVQSWLQQVQKERLQQPPSLFPPSDSSSVHSEKGGSVFDTPPSCFPSSLDDPLLQHPPVCSQRLLLQPLQLARAELARDLRDSMEEEEGDGGYERVERQWHYFTPSFPPFAPSTWPTDAVREDEGMEDDVIGDEDDGTHAIGRADDVIGVDDNKDDIDVVGLEMGEEEERQWPHYTPVLLPPVAMEDDVIGSEDDVMEREDTSVPSEKADDVGNVGDEMKRGDDVIDDVSPQRKEEEQSPPVHRASSCDRGPAAAAAGAATAAAGAVAAVPPRARRTLPAARPETAYFRPHLGAAHVRQLLPARRAVLSKEQREVCSSIMARCAYLWPAERATLARAIGITERQVHNVFTSGGGRATQRREEGTSTEEAQRVIREELLKHGYTVKDEDGSGEKE